MAEENRMRIIEMRLNEIESLVRGTRTLLAALIAICLIGFSGLSNLMDIIVSNVGIMLLIMIVAAPVCYLILLALEKVLGVKKKLSFTDDDMQRILKEIESEKKNESS